MIAQLGERFPCTEEVAGSTPVHSTITTLGRLAEWLNALVLKTSKGLNLSNVRILHLPPPLIHKENGMDKMTFIDYKFYLNEDGDVSLDDDPDLGNKLGIKVGDLLRVSTDAKGRLTLKRFGFFEDS